MTMTSYQLRRPAWRMHFLSCQRRGQLQQSQRWQEHTASGSTKRNPVAWIGRFQKAPTLSQIGLLVLGSLLLLQPAPVGCWSNTNDPDIDREGRRLSSAKSPSLQPTCTDFPLLVPIFEEILQAPVPYANEEEMSKSQQLVEALTEEQATTAARTSYAYWYLESETNSIANSVDTSASVKSKMAAKEARRHLAAEGGNLESALQRLQEACQFRTENEVELVRTCFSSNSSTEREAELMELIERDFHKQSVVMRGLGNGDEKGEGAEKHPRPVVIKFPRFELSTSEEEYMQTQLYLAERAVACTEFATRGREDKVLVVMDGGSKQHSAQQVPPPLSWQLAAVKRIQHLYPERLERLIIVDAPFWMRTLYRGIRPFLPKATSSKIQLLSSSSSSSGDKQVEAILNRWGTKLGNDSGNQLGTNSLTSPVDVHRYLHDTPFFCPYDYACETFEEKQRISQKIKPMLS